MYPNRNVLLIFSRYFIFFMIEKKKKNITNSNQYTIWEMGKPNFVNELQDIFIIQEEEKELTTRVFYMSIHPDEEN